MEKIKQLLNEGVITIEEVLEYVEKYQRAMDAFDDEMLKKYMEDQEYDIPDEYYGDYECSEGTLHPHNEECDCPNYKEEMYYSLTHSPNPEYIVASTLRDLEETLLFECDENGYIISTDDYSGIADRWVPGIDWTDSDLAVTTIFGNDVFERISDVKPHERGYYVVYKRINITNP